MKKHHITAEHKAKMAEGRRRFFEKQKAEKLRETDLQRVKKTTSDTSTPPQILVSTPSSSKARLEEVAKELQEGTHEEVQAAINKWAEKGDSTSQIDNSNLKRTTDASDAVETEEEVFRRSYELASKTGFGYLKNARGRDGKTLLVPPNMQVHPKLGAWGYLHHGLWMMMRWAYSGPKNNLSAKIHRGYQFFEGKVWCERLGLLPEVYMSKGDNRINYLDVVLMWHTDAYVARHLEEVSGAYRDMRQAVDEKLQGSASGIVRGIRVVEGSDAEVIREVREMKESASGTKVSVTVP